MKNAIERRLEQLSAQWSEFAENPSARILRWVAGGDELRMIDLFLEAQNEGFDGGPDLFVRLNDPFDDPSRYGHALRESLTGAYRESRRDLAAAGISADWACPPAGRHDSALAAFAEACVSFRGHYEGLMAHLVLAIVPASVGDGAAWRQWLKDLLDQRLPPNVRFLVVDDRTHPSLDELAKAEPVRMVSVDVELNMPGAYDDLLAGAPGGDPGSRFRRCFVGLANASARGDIAGAERAAETALAIAAAEKWPALETAVCAALGAAYSAAGKTAQALDTYRRGARAAAGFQDPAAGKLAIQSHFSAGAVLVGQGRFEEAAEAYEKAGPIAEREQLAFESLESWRMAAYCREMAGQPSRAWDHGQKALAAGARLEAAMRPRSTLPYLGQALLRLAERPEYSGKAAEVRKKLAALCGEDWEETAGEVASP